MLNFISWSEYFSCLLIAIIVYYLMVWLIVFRGRIPGFSFSQRGLHEPAMAGTQFIMDELRPLFRGKTHANELIEALNSQLRKYRGLDPVTRRRLNEFIVHESEITCSIRLSEQDMDTLWME